MLDPAHVERLLCVERRFCRTPSCDVLYYGPDGSSVRKREARVRVGLKETQDPIPLCYCFGFSRADVEREIAQAGSCTIPAQIAAEIHAGRCACEVKNPSGACCLGDVRAAVAEVTARASHLVFASGSPRTAADAALLGAVGRGPTCDRGSAQQQSPLLALRMARR
jgi:hypothetical protein